MTSATQKPSDFVQVQLTADGAKVAPVRVSNAHFTYLFKPGAPVRVLTSEWSKVLSKEQWAGKPLFELVPPAAVPTGSSPATPAAAPTAATTQKGN